MQLDYPQVAVQFCQVRVVQPQHSSLRSHRSCRAHSQIVYQSHLHNLSLGLAKVRCSQITGLPVQCCLYLVISLHVLPFAELLTVSACQSSVPTKLLKFPRG